MMDALSTAVNGLNRAQLNFNRTSERFAQGDLEPQTVVDSKVAQRDVEAQLVSIRAISEVEDTALDLLA
jgi:hypothetical protein